MPEQDELVRWELEFDSADGTSRIHAQAWWPTDPRKQTATPRGIVQVVHGMCEHVTRYAGLAEALSKRGFLVCGHDQIGHGESCEPERWGLLPPDGKEMLIEDVNRMRRLIDGFCEPGTPHFLLGHSMGSFTTRCYLARHGEGLSGAIISGTGTTPTAVSRAGNALARLICATKGSDYKSQLLHKMADGAYADKIPDRRTDFDWLSYDEGNVDDYIADPACGFMFGAGGYATLTDLTGECCTPACAAAVPSELPLLFVAGANDPVGNCGKGVQEAAQLAKQVGSKDVTCRIYEGMRHEILNEAGRDRVMEDITSWMEDRL